MDENQGIPQGYPAVPPQGYPEGYSEGYPAAPVEGSQEIPQEAAPQVDLWAAYQGAAQPLYPEDPQGASPAVAPEAPQADPWAAYQGAAEPMYQEASQVAPQVDPQAAAAAAYQVDPQAAAAYQADPQVAAAAAYQVDPQAAAAAAYQVDPQAAAAAAYQVDPQVAAVAAYQANPQAAAVPSTAFPQAVVPVPAQEEPEKKKKKKKGCLWRIIFWLALIVLISSLGTLGFLFYTYYEEQDQYNQIAERAFGEPDDSATLADLKVDWDALRAINPDVVAWVYVPGTVINYPVAHKDGDSDYYLHHNFSNDQGKFGAEFGCILLSGENKGDFSDEVNILYGHHMRNGSMFATFAEFRESEEFNKHRTIYLLTPDGNYRLTTFGVEHVPMTHASIATPNYATDEEFNEFKQWLIDNSIVDADPNTDDRVPDATKLFGFCTCDGADNTWRYITFATVSEFCPADMIGSDEYKGRKVKDTTIEKVADAAEERNE